MKKIDESLEKIFEDIYRQSQHFQEMARIGKVGDFIISVFSDEGPIPHFHFMNTQTGQQGCLMIQTNEYFKHGKYQAELNSGERKQMQSFLESITAEQIYKEGTTNFMVICHEWNKNNPSNTIDINTPIPNYRELL